MSSLRVGFILFSSVAHPSPSTRIAALSLFPALREAGLDPFVAFEQARADETPQLSGLADTLIARGCDVAVFQKVYGSSAEQCARDLRRAGIATVFMVCDRIVPAMTDATDATVVVTEVLRQLYPQAQHERVHVVHDGIERPDVCKRSWTSSRGSRREPLHAVFVTSNMYLSVPQIGVPPAWLTVTMIGPYPKERGWRYLRWCLWQLRHAAGWGRKFAGLRFFLHPRIRLVAWDLDGVYRELEGADIGIIPVPMRDQGVPKGHAEWETKSENRLTLMMAVGLPVIASPVPSYLPVVEQGSNAFIAPTPGDWWAALEALRDPSLRKAMGMQARASVIERFSVQAQVQALLKVLRGVSPPSAAEACAPAASYVTMSKSAD